MPFPSTSIIHFMTFLFVHVQKSLVAFLFCFLFLPIFSPFLFLLFLSICCSCLPTTGLASSSRIPGAGNSCYGAAKNSRGKFCSEFVSQNWLLSIFVDISHSVDPKSLIWVSLERSPPLVEVECKWSLPMLVNGDDVSSGIKSATIVIGS